jgi:signal transduction histidine kinase
MRGWEPSWRRDASDVALAIGVGVLVIADAALAAGPPPASALDYVLLSVAALALAARRRAPRVVLLVTTVCVVWYLLRTEPSVIPVVPVLVAKYTAVSAGHRYWAIGVVSPVVAGALYANLTGGDGTLTRDVVADAILPLGWFTAAFVMGEVSRQRQAYLNQVEQRAIEAERSRDETARRRATEERLRIARELHDSLTHSISVIKVQAGVATHLARKRGEDVPDTLLAIQEASQDATRELRATLDVLRGTPDQPGSADVSGLDQLPDLVERSRSAGVPATVTVRGERRVLPPEVDRAAYRIVQEALTNVARHADRASATVRIEYTQHGLVIQVDNDGVQVQPANPPMAGVGLLGMRERVVAVGGQLQAAPRPEGGFSVRAEIPLHTKAPVK